jgi:phospholipase/carboxylesterase
MVFSSESPLMVVTPANSSQRLVILFHGLGSSGSVMLSIIEPWRKTLATTRFAAPNGLLRSTQGGYQWFRIDGQELQPAHVALVRGAFDRLIADVVKREGFENALSQVAFVGVSQGAIMALDAVASGRWKVGALVTFAGLLPLPPASTATHIPVLLVHGDSDPRIPSQASKVAADQLRSAGFDVELEVLPGVGHTISPEGSDRALAFLRTRFAS